jgi:hypothetical protein
MNISLIQTGTEQSNPRSHGCQGPSMTLKFYLKPKETYKVDILKFSVRY